MIEPPFPASLAATALIDGDRFRCERYRIELPAEGVRVSDAVRHLGQH